MSFTIVASLVKSTTKEDFLATTESVLSQSVDSLTLLVIDHENITCSELLSSLLEKDTRVKTVQANGRTPAESEYEEALKSQTDFVRFIHFGQELLPGALKNDAAHLDKYSWVASTALDDLHGKIYHPVGSSNKEIERGKITDQWAQETVNLIVHPMTVAYRKNSLPKTKPTIRYAYYTEMLAVVNEQSIGYFTDRPTMIIPSRWLLDEDDKRPLTYPSERTEAASKLINIRNRHTLNKHELWNQVSDYAWLTREEGHSKLAQKSESLWEVLVQTRKYHYRFDWWGLLEYAEPVVEEMKDEYLTALVLTAKAASKPTPEEWNKLLNWYSTIKETSNKITHLVLTVVFETGLNYPWLVSEAVKIAEELAQTYPKDAVLYYRLTTFYRILGRLDLSRENANRATQLLRGADPEFSDHLRERLLLEKLLTVGNN